MFCFQSQDLIVSFFRYSLSLISEIVKFFDLVNNILNFFLIVLIDSGLVALLLSTNINFFSQISRACLQVIVSLQRLVKLVLKDFDLILIKLHLGWAWSCLFQTLLFFIEFFKSLLVLVLVYKELPSIDDKIHSHKEKWLTSFDVQSS